MTIGIFGASSNHLAASYFEAAERLGTMIAEAGDSIIFGGGADGLMGACARGAKEAGGRIIGVAQKMFDEPGFLLRDCDEFLMTETMAQRKEQMLSRSDGFIALPGGIGTMDEFFEAITLKQLGLVHGPLVLLNTNGFYDRLLELLEQMTEQGFMSKNCLVLVRVCSTGQIGVPTELSDAGIMTGSHIRTAQFVCHAEHLAPFDMAVA